MSRAASSSRSCKTRILCTHGRLNHDHEMEQAQAQNLPCPKQSGAPQEQAPPGASYSYLASKTLTSTEDGKKIERTIQERFHVPLPLDGSTIDVALDLEHRQKGLLWYSTYKVAFVGLYTFRNTS